jgi:ubiquinone/menaquinone biosynthesis C-methylase UbiE
MSESGAWWDAFTDGGGISELEVWLGGVDEWSRVRVRQRIAECEYATVLDCGAGLGLDFYGMANINHECSYQGIEPSRGMREAAAKIAQQRSGTVDGPPILPGDITAIPYPNAAFELVYCRHVLEHLPTFETALTEMLRVAKLEMMAVFFMRPGREAYLTRERDGLFQNRYAKADIDDLLAQNPRALCWFWESLHGQECILHCIMSDAQEVEQDRVVGRLRREGD